MVRHMLRCILTLCAGAFGVLLGCTTVEGTDHPADSLRYPIGIVADPAGDYVYVVNSNFDLAHVGGAIVPLDLETNKLVSESAVQVNSFGGRLALREVDGKAVGLYLPARGTNTLTWVELSREEETGAPRLSCSETAPEAGRLATCNGRYVFGGDEALVLPGVDPFGVTLRPPMGDEPGYVITSAFDGTASVFRLSDEGQPTLAHQETLTLGTYDLAMHPVTGHAYATSKFANVVFTLDVNEVNPDTDPETDGGITVTSDPAVVVTNPTPGKDLARGFAFNAAGTLGFIAYRAPPSLVVVDTSVAPTGEVANRVLDSVPLADGPASVAVAPTGADGRELVYVTLYDAAQIAVVDPKLFDVIAVIDVGQGPFDLVIVQNEKRKRAYVTLFEENAVAVIDVDPESPFYHQEIARVP